MAGISRQKIRAELDRLLLRVPLGADRHTLEACSQELRAEARWERGMCDNQATADHLHEEADIYELAAQERFPREGDGMAQAISARLSHKLNAKHWTCTNCGNVEELTFYPDCCSFCGGSMETQDGRSTVSSDFHCNNDVLAAAYEGDASAVVTLWFEDELPSSMRPTIDEMLAANRLHMLETIYGVAA
jgi:hypothetical protein